MINYKHPRLRLRLVAMIIGSFWASAAAAQEYYGIPIGEGGVAFLLDVSGSMEGKSEGSSGGGGLLGSARRRLADAARNTGVGRSQVGRAVLDRAESETTKLGAARRELFTALGSLSGWTRFTIITFGSRAQEWPGGMRLAGRTERLAAQSYALSLGADGGTPLADALRIAFDKSDVQTVFVVSDGKPDGGGVIRLIEDLQEDRSGAGMVIHTVGIGEDQDADLLCQIAEENGGVYVRDGAIRCESDDVDARGYPRIIDGSSIRTDRRVAIDLDATNTAEVVSGDRYLRVNMRSLSILPDGIRFTVQSFPLDISGNPQPIVTNGSFAAGGHFVSSGSITFDGGPNPYGTLWRVHVPPQSSPGGPDSDGVDLYLEYNHR